MRGTTSRHLVREPIGQNRHYERRYSTQCLSITSLSHCIHLQRTRSCIMSSFHPETVQPATKRSQAQKVGHMDHLCAQIRAPTRRLQRSTATQRHCLHADKGKRQ
ncbi:hypothetical protein AOLI_G00037640 [Acnodon oligacanthus]